MFKKILKTILTLALVPCMLIGCGSEKNAKIFTVGFDSEFPPYGYVADNGDYVGFDLDLAAEVCKRQGWELVKKPINWDSKDFELQSGAIDCIWNGFTMSSDRVDTYTWSNPYIDNSQVVVVKKASGVTKLSDLAGKLVCVQAASSALEAIESEDLADFKASLGSISQVPDYNTAFLNLESDTVDAVAMDIGVAKYQIASRGDAYIILDEQLVTEKYAIGFLKGNTELRDTVQKVMDEMKADGTLADIAKKYDDFGLSDSLIK